VPYDPGVRILFIADIFGAPGRRAVEMHLPELRAQHGVDLVVANAENAADGVGVTSRIALKLYTAGVDAITLGNHAYRQRAFFVSPRVEREEAFDLEVAALVDAGTRKEPALGP